MAVMEAVFEEQMELKDAEKWSAEAQTLLAMAKQPITVLAKTVVLSMLSYGT